MANSEIVNAVQETCMLARVSFSTLGLTRTDRTASSDVVSAHGAVAGAARVVVSRLAGVEKHHKAIVSVQHEARKTLHGLSMPYGEESSWRLLPTRNFELLIKRLAGHKADYDNAVKALRDNADDIVAKARSNIGTLDVPVPTVDELVNAYSFQQDFQPVPDGSTLKGLPEAIQRRLASNIERKVAQAVELAQIDTLERFVDPLTNFVDRMTAYETRVQAQARGEEIGKSGIFKNTVITNIKELFDVLGSFNVVGDERLTELGNKLASLAAVTPETLRDNEAVRQAATERAREVLGQLDGWLNPVPQEVAA